jgi:AAA15 family ATPase/GTPase
MRMVACAFTGLTGPVTDGFFRFADVTAIVGPNDSGKSRLLAAFDAALDGRMPPASSPHETCSECRGLGRAH